MATSNWKLGNSMNDHKTNTRQLQQTASFYFLAPNCFLPEAKPC